ncbi:unnamed protein product [Adineta ricciae]|uniref:Uncharacterized protein n=1 Tax=Adineta ricciae TaxID=249248 RepID=A0A815G0Q2_ADIRI|nr:unnamed protein product [Adineta ricciae]CAF1384355.1 unnamed protein product [Adineta ricciae]
MLDSGEYDCIDVLSSSTSSKYYVHKPLLIDCDDRLCPNSYYPCGDGQCIRMLIRRIYHSYMSRALNCYSIREYSGICETAVPNIIVDKI